MVRKSVLSGKTWQDWSQKDVISSSKINFPDFNFKKHGNNDGETCIRDCG